MLALTLEFDASSVKSRVRTGLIQVDSVYHLLVPCPLIRELGNLTGKFQLSSSIVGKFAYLFVECLNSI